ncbi:MAG: (2Fe-2S)-binding protein [Gammaproteobacteria bacterium]|nr:(2Fe-2S)-binding protein [Gammaproteobacteria bacterium]
MVTFKLNNNPVQVDVDAGTPLLWVLRDSLKKFGTKYGCGRALCGACTVHLDGAPVRACVVPIEAVADRKVTTIEGLGEGGQHPLQAAWIAADVPQCGYCQSGQIMSAAALLASNPDPRDPEIDVAMRGNICRCGTYDRIRRAIKDAGQRMRAGRSGQATAADPRKSRA